MNYKIAELLQEIGTLPEFYGRVLDVNMRGIMGNFPIHAASTWLDADAMKTLIEYGADINCIGENGETPLFRAVRENATQFVELMIACGADVDIANAENIKPLDIAEFEGFVDLAALLKRHSKMS